jgi:hypothetical protein
MIISEATRQRFIKYQDAAINEAGRDCTLLYPSQTVDCPNCIYDPTTQRSSNKFKTGGPRPFPNGTICPVCRGTGKLTQQPTAVIKLELSWNPRQWIFVPENIVEPNSWVQTKGFLTDIDKVLRSRKIVVQLSIPPYSTYIYELSGEPFDSAKISPGRYFTAMWKRTGSAS